LKHYHDGTIAVLIGFMVGALGSVWPFWSYRYTFLPLKLGKGPQLYVVERVMPGLSSDIFLYSLCFAAAGFCLVFLLEWIAQKRHV
jgi:putative membrane protein